MDSKGNNEEVESSNKPAKKSISNKPSLANEAGLGSLSSKDLMCRADKIDFKTWDLQLEKHLSQVWSRDRDRDLKGANSFKKEEWEIELSKLDLKHVIAHGTYGTVYKAVYDGKEVAVKVLDWGEDGMATAAETAALRESFRKEVAVWHKLDHPNVTKFLGASMGTSNLKIPTDTPSGDNNSHPSRACCVIVEYLAGGTLKHYLIRNRKRKLAIKIVNLRPDIPRCCPPALASIMRKCWDANPDKRPNMDEVVRLLEGIDTSKGGGMIPDDQVAQGCFCFGPSRGP
ncbi:Serine/threonine-protein kinase HT1 [Bienertia sinuspersici]